MMGAGKTTLGRKAHSELSIPFVDLDFAIETFTAMPINSIFKEKGEPFFRKIETELLKKELYQKKRKLISLGGGTIIKKENREIIKKKSISVFLDVPISLLEKRLYLNPSKRPILSHLKTNLKKQLVLLLQQRLKYYQEADFVLKSTNKAQNLSEIKKIWYG